MGTRGRRGTFGGLSLDPEIDHPPVVPERATQRIAILGCGFIGTIHPFALRAVIRGGLADAAVVAACDADLDKAKRVLEAHGSGVATTDTDEALDAADVAWVCTPTSSHEEIVERCASHGLPVYCEKPLAKDLTKAEVISRLIHDAGLLNQVGLVLRHAPPFTQIAALCRGETVVGGPDPDSLGAPMAAQLRDDQFFPVGGMYGSDWRADVDVAGGGTLLEHSIHDVDMLAFMLGPIVNVTARTANHAGHRGIEDLAAVTFEHSTGAFSNLLSVWHDLETRPSTRRLEVFFERAHAVLEDEQVGPVRVEHAGATTEVGLPPDAIAIMDRLAVPEPIRPAILAYSSADLGFLQSVAAGRPPSPGVDAALEAHKVVDAAYRSAALGGEPQATGVTA
jgi:UDP-N-acetyl-2-amino-2-deoxyglucuronate dehydrogenase